MTDSVIRSRIDSTVKAKATKLFEHMALSMSDAIRLFLYQSLAEKGLPFRITSIPNAKTAATLQEIRERPKKLKKTSLEQLEMIRCVTLLIDLIVVGSLVRSFPIGG